ncbi:MAG: EAL domain-containing protein [Arenicellales bacterium]|nr:EAL domain-containing protein [Arenicellales bacterium]
MADTSDLAQHLEAMGLDSSSELEMYQSLFANAPIAMAISTPEGQFVHVNPALCDLLGYSEQEILSDKVVITHPEELNVNKYIQNYIKNPTIPSLSLETRYIHRSGRVIFGLLNIAPFRDRDGNVVRLVVQIVDLSERHELETRNRYLAYTDPITDLPNRRAVFERLKTVLEDKSNHRNPAFIYLDLDRFKVINDTFGHQVGDLLLKEIGAKLRQVIHEQHYVGRIGGDEFGIVIADSSNTDLKQLAVDIRQAMRIPVRAKNLELPVDVSVGAAIYPKGGVTVDELITNADIAMYHAKRHHVDFQSYTEDINEYSERLFVQESKLRQAISQQDFYLDLEHACHIDGGALSFCEGLLRWKQDDEIVAPYHFVPIAESTGLIRKLDSITLQLASQLDYKSEVPTVAINLSRLSLLDNSIVDEISSYLSGYGLDPKNLIVEVTETVAVSDTEKIASTLTNIKSLGLLIALDDFGTGFTSFSMLKQLPLDVLKIDKSLIKGIGRSAVDEKIIIATINIGHELGLEVVAEGVETEQQLEWLHTHHCDIAQGWHITSKQTP